MYQLTDAEKTLIDSVKLQTGNHTSPDDQIYRFVQKYEANPARYTKRGSKIRYLISKRGFSLGEMEALLGLTGGSISSSSTIKNDRTDAFLSRLLDVPVNELRVVQKQESIQSQLKTIAKSLRNIAATLDTL